MYAVRGLFSWLAFQAAEHADGRASAVGLRDTRAKIKANATVDETDWPQTTCWGQ